MSFLTEYFDEYRPHKLRKTFMCRPEVRFAKLQGKWLDPKVGKSEKELTNDEINAFIKKTMQELRGQSTYYNDYCAHLPPELKTRKLVPRIKDPCETKKLPVEEASAHELPAPLALKDTEVMKVAQALYERDMDEPTLEPLPTHFRVHGYMRPRLLKTGLSEYTESYARLAYELVKSGRIPKYQASNGCRERWGLPPEGVRQPELDVLPFDGDRLYN